MNTKHKNLIATLIAWVVVAASSHASSISIHGFAEIVGGGPTVYYSDSALNGSISGSAVTFDPADPSIISRASSTASQTSSVNPLGFSFAQNFECIWRPPLEYPGFRGRAGAGATTDFGVSIIVLTAVDYQLTLSAFYGGGNLPGDYVQRFAFNGLTFPTHGTFSGTLLPGTYEFDSSLFFFHYDGLFSAANANAHGEMTFSAPVQILGVPDAGFTLGLFSFALIGLACYRKYENLDKTLCIQTPCRK